MILAILLATLADAIPLITESRGPPAPTTVKGGLGAAETDRIQDVAQADSARKQHMPDGINLRAARLQDVGIGRPFYFLCYPWAEGYGSR